MQAEESEKHPWVFIAVSVEYIVTGDGVRPDVVARAVELSQTKYYSVHAMLRQALPIAYSYRVEAAV